MDRRIVMRARTVAGLAPEASAVDWFDAATPGLALHVTPAGSRTWYFFNRRLRTTRRVKLGTYPAVELAKPLSPDERAEAIAFALIVAANDMLAAPQRIDPNAVMDRAARLRDAARNTAP